VNPGARKGQATVPVSNRTSVNQYEQIKLLTRGTQDNIFAIKIIFMTFLMTLGVPSAE
jgi:hypothetical protein